MSMDSYRGAMTTTNTNTTSNNNSKASAAWYEQCQHQSTMLSNELETNSTNSGSTNSDMQLLEEARKICMQDIDVACKKLGISPGKLIFLLFVLKD